MNERVTPPLAVESCQKGPERRPGLGRGGGGCDGPLQKGNLFTEQDTS